MPANQKYIHKRQNALYQAMQDAGYGAMAFNPGPSLRYLTGLNYFISERPIIGLFSAESGFTIVVPELEASQLDGADFDLRAFSYGEDPDTWPGVFAAAAKEAGITGGTIGVEALCMRVMELRLLENAIPGAAIQEGDAVVAALRRQKDESEIANMRKAVGIAQRALESTLADLKAGMSEKEAASELVAQLFRQGSEAKLPFEPIVASGPNGAIGHAHPGERKLTEGDLLVIDFGTTTEGYFSDITRTFAVGQVDEELAKIHRTVQEANAAARAAVKPGATCGSVDDAARGVIEAAGYGEYFIHRTGHGLGLEIHEEPYMRAGNKMALEPGMTFTIEPGIYLPGRGGVRIEDNMVVTETGGESLTDLPREMHVID